MIFRDLWLLLLLFFNWKSKTDEELNGFQFRSIQELMYYKIKVSMNKIWSTVVDGDVVDKGSG